MNDALKMALMSLVKSIVDRAVVGAGIALLTHGWLTASQQSLYEQVGSGLIMVLVGALVGWYRDHGKALVQAEAAQLNAQVDALTKKIQEQPVKK